MPFFSIDTFDAMMEAELGTFLSPIIWPAISKADWDGMGLTAHPELKDMIFGHYTKVTYLAQLDPAPYVGRRKRQQT